MEQLLASYLPVVIFAGVAAFLFGAAIVYGLWTHGETGHLEWIGTVALILSGLLCSMCGGFFWFVSRRIDARPEDRPEAEIADGAGEVGFFSPGSYWPFGLALGMVMVVLGAAGLLFEYYSGTRHTAEH